MFIEILNKKIKNIPLKKALTQFYGINSFKAIEICKILGFNPNKKINQFHENQLKNLKNFLERKYHDQIEKTLSQKIETNIKNLIAIKSYRGFRHKNGLPVRGQRTHSNARTQKKLFSSFKGGGK